MPDKISPSEFAKKIKQKYPAYNNVDDSTLVSNVLKKYPAYSSTVDMSIGFSKAEKDASKIQVASQAQDPVFKDKNVTTKDPVSIQPEQQPIINQTKEQKEELSPSKTLSFAETFGDIRAKPQIPSSTATGLAKKVQAVQDVMEAPVRIAKQNEKIKQSKDLALKNTTKKNIEAKGIKYTEGDSVWKKTQEEILKAVSNEDLVLTTDKDKNPVYKRSLGMWDSIVESAKTSYNDEKDGAIFENANIQEKIKIANKKLSDQTESFNAPSPYAGRVGEFLGENAIMLGQSAAGAKLGAIAGAELSGGNPYAAALGGAGGVFLALAPSAYAKGFTAETISRYNEGLQKVKKEKGVITHQDELDQMNRAVAQGTTAGLADVANVAVLSLIPGSAAAKKGFINVVKHAVKSASKDALKFGATSGATSVAKDVSANINGYNVSNSKILDNFLTASGHGMSTALAFSLYHQALNVPKYVKSATKEYLSTLPTLDLNNASKALEAKGIIPEGSTAYMSEDLRKYNEAKAKVPPIVPEEHMSTYAGLIQLKTNLEQQKTKSDKSFHAKIDEQIANVDERIKKVLESKDPVLDEVDDLTGDTGIAPPQTDADIETSLEVIEGPELEVTKSTVLDNIGRRVSYNGKDAQIFRDGKTVVVSIEGTNREIEIGNIDEIGDTDISKFGIEYQGEIELADNNDFTIRGKRYVNNFSKPESAITYDADGYVESVSLDTPTGGKRTFRGTIADEIALQIKLKEISKTDETKQEFEQFIESDESAKQQIISGENESAAKEGAAKVVEEIPRPEEKQIEIKPAPIEITKSEADFKVGDIVVDSDGNEYEILELNTSRKGTKQAFVKLPKKTKEEIEALSRLNVFNRDENRLIYKSENDPKFIKDNAIAISEEISQQINVNNGSTASKSFDLADLKLKTSEETAKPTEPVREIAPPPIEIEPISFEGPKKGESNLGFNKSASEFKEGDIITDERGERFEVIGKDGKTHTKLKNLSDIAEPGKMQFFANAFTGFKLYTEPTKPFRATDSDAIIHYGNVGEKRGNIGDVLEILEEVEIDKLIPDPFADIVQENVEKYSNLETEIPPIEVHRDEDGNTVYDGNTRLLAAKKRGQKTIKAWVSTVGEDGKFIKVKEAIKPISSEPTKPVGEVTKVEIKGAEDFITFSSDVKEPFKYKLIEQEDLKPSHLPSGERNPEHRIALAQPKERGDKGSVMAQDKIASDPNIKLVGENDDAFKGAPVVNGRNEVIQGNNRSIGLKNHYRNKGTSYKEQLAENAEKFGFTKDQVDGMKNPVLVREVDVDDARAVELGNYDVKDLETGGTQRVDPITTIRRISSEDKVKLASLLFEGDGKTIKQSIADNAQQVAKIISNYINPAQRNTIFTESGDINARGMQDIEAIVTSMIFESGPATLPEVFEGLPYQDKKNIEKAIKYIFSAEGDKSILPEVQNAILGLHEYYQSGVGNFETWVATMDIFKGVTPKDVFTPVELKMVEKIIKAKNQSALSIELGKYNELVNGVPADMFTEATEGISKAEAIKKQFKVEYDDISKGYTEPKGETRLEEPIRKEENDYTKLTKDEKLDREYRGTEKDDIIRGIKELGGIDEVRRLYESEGYKELGEPLEQFILRKGC